MGFLKKITKPISKFLDKVVPNEVKPFLPYAAAAAPFLAPAGFGIGSLGPIASRAILAGGANLASQLAQEGSEGDFSTPSVLLSSGIGALSAPGFSDYIEKFRPVVGGEGNLTGLQSIGSKGISLLQRGSQGLQGIMEAGKADPFSMAGVKAASLPTIQGTSDLAYAEGNRQMKAYEQAMAEFNRLQKEGSITSYNDYYDNILKYMNLAGFTTEEAESAAENVLSGINFAQGGRVGYYGGGDVTPPGMEMDLRVGGFIPIGRAERADDVKARVSKNEFVMTSDAVRGMGNGDPNVGAKRMYQLMNNLEARTI
jgi:hypothetical protein